MNDNNSPLQASDIRLMHVHNDYVNRLSIHLTSGKTISRTTTAQETKEFFRLTIAEQKQYVADLCNNEYQQPQRLPQQARMSVEKERFLLLESERKIGALPTDKEAEYQQLKQALYGYDY
jgi:hypothetical protein